MSKPQIARGQVIGLWRVVGRATDLVRASGTRNGKPYHALIHAWLCRCSCGKKQVVAETRLVNGKSGGCRGCRTGQAKRAKHAEESIGKKYNHWTVIAHDGERVTLRCVCGKRRVFAKRAIHNSASCGCQRDREKGKSEKAERKYRALVGRKYGEASVIGYSKAPRSKTPRRVHRLSMLCDCGHKFIAAGPDVSAGKVNSCGCRRRRNSGTKHKARAIRIDVYGEPMTIAEIAELVGVSRTVIEVRLRKYGATALPALLAPKRRGDSTKWHRDVQQRLRASEHQ